MCHYETRSCGKSYQNCGYSNLSFSKIYFMML